MTAAVKVPVDGGPYALAARPDGALWVALEAGFVLRMLA
jgi:virginiamycin B lyase